MASISTALLARKKKEPQDDEQLLQLFRNRAELKKELATLRREKDKLSDLIRQQEGLTQRAQQRLEHLESLLADPAQAANALVYYQLRGVWQHGRRRLERLARDLEQRQQEREFQYDQVRFEQTRDAAISAIEEKLGALAERRRVMEDDLKACEEGARRLRGFWNYFRRRRLHDQAEAIRASIEGVQGQAERLERTRHEREGEPGPAFKGLSIDGKRNINLAVIAMAQHLLVHYAENEVALLAREAAVRSLTDVSYGDAADCRSLTQAIDSVTRQLEPPEQLNARVRRRSEYLRQVASYRRDHDTVPVVGSVAGIPLSISETGEPRPIDDAVLAINVLADEYWDIYAVLLN
jgi:hypothetical protein